MWAGLEQGVRWGWLRENPAARASPGPGQVPEIHPPAPAAVLALLQRAERDDKAFAMFLVLAAVTGARRGELVALRWSDLDLERGALTITQGISEGVDGPVEHPSPKTRGSVRRLALDQATVAILAAHRCRHADAAAACGASLPGDAFVFSHEPDGSVPWKPGYVSLEFRRLRHSVGLDQVRLHDLRHLPSTRTSSRPPTATPLTSSASCSRRRDECQWRRRFRPLTCVPSSPEGASSFLDRVAPL